MKASSTAPKKHIIKGELSCRLRLPACVLAALCTGLGLSYISQLITFQSIREAFSWFFQHPLPAFGCALFLMLLVLLVALASRSVFAGGASVSLLVLVVSFVNYFKNLIASTPLKLSDIALLKKLDKIATLNSSSITFSRNSILAIAAVLLWLGVLFVISRQLSLRWRLSLPCAGAACLVFGVLFCVRPVANSWLYRPLATPLYTNYGETYVYGKTGPLLGLWRFAIDNNAKPSEVLTRDSDNDGEPDIIDEARDMLAEVPAGGGAEQPNVIFVLAESFFDLTELPGVEYDSDPLSDYHRAEEEGVSGAFHTRTLGYGTCAIEMEVLTGINTRLLTSDQLLSEWNPEEFDKLSTVPRLFSENGYYTAFMHTFDDSIYGRTPTYSHFGFDDIYFSGDYAKVVPEAAEAEDYWSYMYDHIAGGYYSDDFMAEAIIDLYEREGEDRPVFLYAATVENHTPFTADKYDEYEYGFTSALSDEAAGVLNSVTQGAANCSKALGKLMDYFSDCGEPTVIVFFGDHKPGLPLEESGGTLYSALGMCPADNSDWSLEELAKMYSTDYVIWANDESLLPDVPGTRGVDSSSNFLGLDVLRLADIELDSYWRMLAAMKADCTAFTWDYFISAQGSLSAAPTEVLDSVAERRLEIVTYLMRDAFSSDEPMFYRLD